MKLNFWQILGILFVIGGLIGIAYNKGWIGGGSETAPDATPSTLPSATQPAS